MLMPPWHDLVARWRAAGYIGWHEHGAAYCLQHGNSAVDGKLIRPEQRVAVQAAGIRCALCDALLVPPDAPRQPGTVRFF